jgi:hypothetical protein
VPGIRRLQRGNVLLSPHIHRLQFVATRPIDRIGAAGPPEQLICRDARVAPIPVWEEVDMDEPMVKSDGDLQGLECFVLDPVSGVAEQGVQLHGDLPWMDVN